MPLTITTTDDEDFDGGNEAAETADGTGLSLREAISLLGTGSTGPVGISAALQGTGTSLNDTLIVSDDLFVQGDFSVGFAGNTPLMSVFQSGLNLNFDDVTFEMISFISSSTQSRTIDITGADVSVTNTGSILATSDASVSIDRSTAIRSTGEGFSLTNAAGGEIVSTGRDGVDAVLGGGRDAVLDLSTGTTINNEGLIQSGDDAVTISYGTVTNSGTILSTGTYESLGVAGRIADGLVASFSGTVDSSLTYTGGYSTINNLSGGLIEAPRSAVLMNGGGTVDNAGIIQGGHRAVSTAGDFDFATGDAISVDFSLNNSGSIIRTGGPIDAFWSNPAAIVAFGSASLTLADITNSGTILSPDLGVFITAQTVFNNTATGVVNANSDGAGDAIALQTAGRDYYTVEPVSTTRTLISTTEFVSADNLEFDDFGTVITDFGVFNVGGRADAVAFRWTNAPILLPLVDEALTIQNETLTFQTDDNGDFIYPSTIIVTGNEAEAMTVTFTPNAGGAPTAMTVTYANGQPVSVVPSDRSFNDTVTNDGIMYGDVLTGLGDDDVTNTGTINGDIDLGEGDDTLTLNIGAAQGDIFGADGDDTIIANNRVNAIDGGDGSDTVSYENSNLGVTVSLLSGAAGGAHAAGDTLTAIENLIGSIRGDNLRGNQGDNVIDGNAGKDILIGYNGGDSLIGGAGRDILSGGNGADLLDGGDSVDQARYNGSSEAVQINLLDGTATGGQAEGDTLMNIENLFGSNHGDTLYGDAENNKLFGHLGDDFLAGNGGINKLYGGSGADSFVLSDGFAFVMDFVDDVDQLDVSDYGFTSLADALLNLDQVGNHARFRTDGDVLFILNTDAADLNDDIVWEA